MYEVKDEKMIIVFLMILFCSMASTQTVHGDDDAPINIVIIHAYHVEYEWTYNQNEGIHKVLMKEFPNANVYTEFLDWKRFPTDTTLEKKYSEFEEKYKDMAVDLLLTTDDMGLVFALDHRKSLFNDAPVVFGGIIQSTASEIIDGRENVTGVYEKMEPEGAIDLLMTLQSEVSKLVIVHDLSESGIRTNETFINALTQFPTKVFEIEDWSNKPFDIIQRDAGELLPDTAIIFISYASSIDGVSMTANAYCQALYKASAVPMYSIDDHQFGSGILGGTFLSGELQGQEIAKLGSRILRGEAADELAPIVEATTYTGVDEAVARTYDIDMSSIGDDLIVINEKRSFFETYRELVIIVSVIFLSLLIFLLILLHMLHIIRRSKDKIVLQNSNLQIAYENIQSSEEELIAQNEELQTLYTQLEFESQHDYLTGLNNRVALETYMKIHLNDRIKAIILFVDLDNFKFINNTFGHQFGDEVLVKLSQNMSDNLQDIYIARIGGDEFILVKFFEAEEATLITNQFITKVNQSLSTEIFIDGQAIKMTTSMGYSLYPKDGKDFEKLLIEADTAMYHVKKHGKSASIKYSSTMSNAFQNEFLLISKLKEGLKNHDFYMVFQPILKSDGRAVVGFEALIRWKDRDLGEISPERFINLAENSGLIIPIGAFVIEQSLLFASRLVKEGYKDKKISINVSIVQLYERGFIESLLNQIDQQNIRPELVQIELTESVMIETFDITINKLNEVKKRGLSIALDDFGTGYSSLSYLHRLPIDVLKIDKSFVDDLSMDGGDFPLVDATINIGKSFGLEIVAEGVETATQCDYLIHKQCDYIQGHYYSEALKADEAIDFLSDF